MSAYFLTNEISIRRQFVTNPEGAVDTLIDAIIHETDNANAATMIKFLYTHNYVETLLDLYMAGRHTDAILQLVGNMLASVNPAIADKGRYFVNYMLGSVFNALNYPSTTRSAAYVIANYVNSSRSSGISIPVEFLSELAQVYTPDFLTNYVDSVRTDLLSAAFEAESLHLDVISVDFILELLSTTQNNIAVVLALLSLKSTETLGDYANIAYAKLVQDILCNETYNNNKQVLNEALFALGNIVVEPDMATHFFEDYCAVDRVKELSEYNNALWVLMNAAVKLRACPCDVWTLLEREASTRTGSTAQALQDTLTVLNSCLCCGTPAESTPPSPVPADMAAAGNNAILIDILELRQELDDLKRWRERVDTILNV